MKKYLVLYRSTTSARQQMASATPEQSKAGMDAWMTWAGKAADAVVDLGSPLGESHLVNGAQGSGDIGGYSILQSGSIAAVHKQLEGHPHLMVPGNTIEVLEFLPVPGM